MNWQIVAFDSTLIGMLSSCMSHVELSKAEPISILFPAQRNVM